jgi:carbon monoxide dehydrogenase subunit G
MTDLHETAQLPVTPATVWSIVRDAGGLATWVPGVAHCRMEGDTRYIRLSDDRGDAVERIVANSDEDRTVEYVFVSGDLPLRTYRSRLSVEPDGPGTRVVWSATFEAAPPASESEVLAGLRESYRAALVQLAEVVAQLGRS